VPEEQERLAASARVSFGDIANLGPHRLEASLTRVVLLDGVKVQEGVEQTRLVWQGWDDFELSRLRDGELRTRVVASGGRGQALASDGTMRPVADLEPYRLELRQAWDVWTPAIGPIQDRVVFEHQGQALLEGRLVDQYALSVRPDDGGPQSTRTVPLGVQGTLWIDELTHVRLMADVTARTTRRGREERVQEDHLVLVRTGFGHPAAADGR
jgi:hypothetical protein